MRKFIIGAASLTVLVAASAANAHDFFLMPGQFRTLDTGTVKIQATVGSNFPKAENTVAADRVERLHAVGAGAPRIRLAGATATALDLEVTAVKPGLLVTAVTTKPRDVDYADDRIPLILGEYRVRPDAVAAVDKLARPRTWLVISRRFAKTFICVEMCGNQSIGERALGTPLEFVGRAPATNHFRLLGEGKPLANYPVDLVTSDGKRQHLATDARGDVHIPATAKGTMMLFAAALEPPSQGERFILDLTSLTFNRP